MLQEQKGTSIAYNLTGIHTTAKVKYTVLMAGYMATTVRTGFVMFVPVLEKPK